MITHEFPTSEKPNTNAPVARQIKSLQKMGVKVDVLEIKGIPKLKYIPAIFSLRKNVHFYDIIHAHYGYCGWLARLQMKKPVVVSFMGDDLLGTNDGRGRIKLLSKFLVKINYRLAGAVDAVIVKSEEMAKVVAPVKAHVIPNGVDIHLFYPMEKRKARRLLGWPEDQYYILFPGNPMISSKGIKLAQDAVFNASNRIGVPLKLMPLNQVGPSEVPIYMNACDLMVFTSYSEGSPNVVKEAMACNLPVISVQVGDVHELFADVPGYVICQRNIEKISEAIVNEIKCPQVIDGRNALIRKGLELKSVAKKVMNIYSQVIAKKNYKSCTDSE